VETSKENLNSDAGAERVKRDEERERERDRGDGCKA